MCNFGSEWNPLRKMNGSMLISYFVIITVVVDVASGLRHHKVRHKHNLLGLRHINEIREAFHEFRSVINAGDRLRQQPTIIEDYDLDNSLEQNDEPARDKIEITTKLPVWDATSVIFPRNKRVLTTTTTKTTSRTVTTKSVDNYDEEYDDDDDNAPGNRRPSENPSNRRSRDSTDTQLQEGESLTDFKMKTLGTREGVDNSFYQAMATMQRENINNHQFHVNQNLRRLETDGRCRWPNKKIFTMPSHPSRTYTPRKYILYQCSDDTACCSSRDKTCVAKKTETVDLWFQVKYVGYTGYELLKVVNHTECECIYKIQDSTRAPSQWPLPTIPTTTKAPLCKCPSLFEAEVDSDGECGCVCKEAASECRQRFEGKEGFTLTDRMCITKNTCVQPTCLYGTYSSDTGRCPNRNDKFNRGFQEARSRESP